MLFQCFNFIFKFMSEVGHLFTQIFLGDCVLLCLCVCGPRESRRRGSLVACHLWGRTESDMTEATQQQQQQYWCVCVCVNTNSGLRSIAQFNCQICSYLCWVLIISWFIESYLSNQIVKILSNNCLVLSYIPGSTSILVLSVVSKIKKFDFFFFQKFDFYVWCFVVIICEVNFL